MKKIFHKNQVIITSLAFLIAIAGYISYDRSTLSEKGTAKTSADSTKDGYEIDNTDHDIFSEIENTEDVTAGAEVAAEDGSGTDTEEIINPGETVLTGTIANSVDYAAEVKLNREQVRSKNKETLLGIINNTNITDEQKQVAVDQLTALTDVAEREANAEMMLESKGFTNVVVSLTGEECDVVLDMGDVTDAKRAQVEDIVKRKTGVSGQNIVITTLSSGQQPSSESTDTQTETLSGTETGE